MRSKNTTAMGREHEESVEKVFAWAHAKRSRSSGASFHDPVDVTSDISVIECEATEGKSYGLKLALWEEVVQKQHSGKLPMLSIRIRDAQNGKHVDLGIIDLKELSAILEELEAYRNDAINP